MKSVLKSFHPWRSQLLVLVAVSLVLVACDSRLVPPGAQGAVYVMTNAAADNEVVVFSRSASGKLERAGSFSTGGLGSGTPPVKDPLGSQDALYLSDDHSFLFAVNAGSNEVSSFTVSEDGLTLTLVNKVSSAGERPVSLTTHGDLLYVVNAGGRGNISGFRVADTGMLSPLSDSTQPLSDTDTPLPGSTVAPGSIRFSPDGGLLVVTEKATSLIDVYKVEAGRPGPPNVQPSAGRTPFGADFDSRGTYIVSETNATAPRMPVPEGASVSSYKLSADGVLNVVSETTPTLETAACWIQITPDDRYVYTTNTASGTITGFRLGDDGTLTRLAEDGITGTTGDGSVPLGMAISGDFLYVLSAGQGEVKVFGIEDDGGLTRLSAFDIGGLPGDTVEGVAAF